MCVVGCHSPTGTDAKESAEGAPLEAAESGVLARYGNGACYGACPVFSVTIYENGKVDFYGTEFTITKGGASKTVSQETLEEIRSAFAKADFIRAEAPVGRTASGSPKTGKSESFLYYAKDGKARRIDLPEGCEASPVAPPLMELRRRLDELVEIEKWIGTAEERKVFGSGYAR